MAGKTPAPKPSPSPAPKPAPAPAPTSNAAMLAAAKAQLAKTQASLAAVQKAQADAAAAQKAAATQALIDKAKASADLIKQKQSNQALAAQLGPGYKYNSATGMIDKVTTTTSTTSGGDDGTNATVYTASDGTKFTDQQAYVAYQAMLNSNARGDYAAAQAAAAKSAADKAEKADAFALIQNTMKAYGFTDSELAALTAFAETQIVDPDIGPNQGILNMKALPVYQARFAGNAARIKAGKNALSEADYLAQENAYGEYMKAYGVQSLGTRDQYATLIGNDVSATELNKRLNLAVDRVKNSDPEILKQLKTYYPSITDADLVTYFLKPADALPDLEKKVATSEISAAAVGQGFAADMTGAADLQAFGVTREKALSGYQDIKTVLPLSEKLSAIYNEAGIKYDRKAGESEFLMNSADAAEKRRRLKSMERGSFSAQTGVERGTSLGTMTQGQF